MCGIVGYIGKRNSLPLLLNGLRRLEYRGYDSAGIAFYNGNGLEIYKTEGKINDLQSILPNPVPEVRVGLGHTRWATHGAPSARNAHPHVSNGIAVVHNGIIENYRQLRFELQSQGFQFYSETDTEVIPKMISRQLENGLTLEESIEISVAQLRGSFALGIMSEAHPNTLFAVRSGSPLVVGISDGEFFFASDIPAILPYTKKFIFLEDRQICKLTEGSVDIGFLGSKERLPIGDRILEVDWTPAMAEKDGFDYFMLKEIHEQPRVVTDTVREWADNPLRLLQELGLTAKMIFETRRLQMVACGTSYHAALIAKYLTEWIAHIPVDVEIASEYRYKHLIIEKNTLSISITQSGETADTLAAQREAKARGARTLTICNVVGSTCAREADSVLYTRAGPEIGVASTKAFIAQLSALFLLAIAIGIKRGRLTSREADSLQNQILKMPELIEKALRGNSEILDLAKTLVSAEHFLFLGRGLSYPIALEGALKLKEISYIHAEGHPAGEMKHGPIALVEDGLPVVVVAPIDELFEKTASNIEEVKARGARVIAVTDDPKLLRDRVDDVLVVPSTHPVMSPFVNVIPLQLLAYHVAVLRGCNVDQPRNLAKSVTVE